MGRIDRFTWATQSNELASAITMLRDGCLTAPNRFWSRLNVWQRDPQVERDFVEAVALAIGSVTITRSRMPRKHEHLTAIELLDFWLKEDETVADDQWERLQTALDRDRLSHRKLFP